MSDISQNLSWILDSNQEKIIDIQKCPHCGSDLKKMEMPPEAGYEVEYFKVCFNDECPYFVRGWSWMMSQFRTNTSYRYFFNPKTGQTGPLPVWSKNAMKDRIIG